MVNFKNLQTLQTIKKLLLCLILSLVISLVFFREFWVSLPVILSPDWIFAQQNASSWGVLALCLIFLWLKRKDVWEEMLASRQICGQKGVSAGNFLKQQNIRAFKSILLGIILVLAAIIMPSFKAYLVFLVLLTSLGIFIIFFGSGAKIPSFLIAIYGFAITFPLAILRFAENTYSQIAITPAMGVMTSLGYPIQWQGQIVQFISYGGDSISVAVTIACAGPATMGVFIALFALMMLDMPLRYKKALWLFGFGVIGTWFQSFIRLMFLLLVGYHWGEGAMWTAHSWTTFILFPLWYLLFVYIYFRQSGRFVGVTAVS